MPIKKFLIWNNPTPKATGPRWDADVVIHDGSITRMSQITKDEVITIIEEIFGDMETDKTTLGPCDGCKYEGRGLTEYPCVKCAIGNDYRDCYEPKKIPKSEPKGA